MSKKKKNGLTPMRNPNAIEVQVKNPENQLDRERAVAESYLRPSVMAAATIKRQYPDVDDLNINDLIGELSTQVAYIKDGDLGRAEACKGTARSGGNVEGVMSPTWSHL